MNERVAALLSAAQENAELRQALQQAATVAVTVQVAADHGIAVTPQDLAEATDVELSDTVLEGSRGGVVMTIAFCDTSNPCLLH